MTGVKRIVALIAVMNVRNIIDTNLCRLHWVGVQIEDNNAALASVRTKNVGITALRRKTSMSALPWISRWASVKCGW